MLGVPVEPMVEIVHTEGVEDMINWIPTVRTVAPLVPCTVRLYVPAGADAETLNVSVDVAAGIGDGGLNVAVTPVGKPVTDNVTGFT